MKILLVGVVFKLSNHRQGNRIGENVYMTEWYRLPHKISLGLVMIISRSNLVVKITAGKFIQISIATFGAVSIRKTRHILCTYMCV